MNIHTALVALSQCLCEVLSDPEYGHPAPCFCGVVPGTQALEEMAHGCSGRNGVAWVRLASTYQSETTGAASRRTGVCSTGLGIDIEVGVAREHDEYYDSDVIDEAGSLAIATWQYDDMLATRRAIACCDAIDEKDYILGLYRPTGPMGGMVGGAWMMHLWTP